MFAINKTKIVCTIGPASRSPEVIKQLIREGMNIARLNFSHGEFESHAGEIDAIRQASKETGVSVAIMADLPGPKIRVGEIRDDQIDLKSGDNLVLTTEPALGTEERIGVDFSPLCAAVDEGDMIFINDGFIQLEVVRVRAPEVECKVVVGGEVRSRKGLNIPDVDLGISAFTEHDRRCMEFALEHGVDAISQSFVERSEDIEAVRKAARSMGHDPFIVAKIERSRAVQNLDAILKAANGIMVARGDLGVEIPIEKIASVQKKIMRKANRLGKPVITATQMLESMVKNRLPTRAEATDVANAILDGADCVMLSGESAVGDHPAEAVRMLRSIAADIEPNCDVFSRHRVPDFESGENMAAFEEIIALSVASSLKYVTPAAIFVPTRSGATARRISRYRLPVWIAGISSEKKTCRDLLFSYGVLPVFEPEHPLDWKGWIKSWLQSRKVAGNVAILTEGPSRKYPNRNNRMEIIDLRKS